MVSIDQNTSGQHRKHYKHRDSPSRRRICRGKNGPIHDQTRAARPQGGLAGRFPNAWAPNLEPLLNAVLAENRRYQQIRNSRLLKKYQLQKVNGRWHCDEELSEQAGGLKYSEMVKLAEQSDFRHALWTIGETTAQLFEQVVERSAQLPELPIATTVSWAELTAKWQRRP